MAAAAALAVTLQFNLVCAASLSLAPPTPYQTYRIDLARRLWCEGPCAALNSLDAKVDRLVLRDHFEADRVGAQLLMHDTTVNRLTGAFFDKIYWITESPNNPPAVPDLIARGSCERAQFSGFPDRKF